MPGLHFLSKKKTSSTPTPLLLAAILYVSALHHSSPEFAALAPAYFVATCNAISELAVPVQAAQRTESGTIITENAKLSEEQKAFQNVLGLILAGLISEAFIETTGLWISMGYRLTLDFCPVHMDERSHEWQGLFSGLQVSWASPMTSPPFTRYRIASHEATKSPQSASRLLTHPPYTSADIPAHVCNRSLTSSMLPSICHVQLCPKKRPSLPCGSCRPPQKIPFAVSRR
jgi:hypothetical protein